MSDTIHLVAHTCCHKGGKADIALSLSLRHYAQQLLRCVLAVHERGFAHLDLKPKHFLQFGGDWKLVDFDNAQPEGAELPATAAACTVRYAAPEVVRARRAAEPLRASSAADVWAMALVLCHLFTGEPVHGDAELEGIEEQLASRPHEVALQA